MFTDGASNSSWEEVYPRVGEDVIRPQWDVKAKTIEKSREEHAAERLRLLDMVDKLKNEVQQRQNAAERANDLHLETMVELHAVKLEYADARRQLDAAIEEKKKLRCRLDVEIKKNKTQEDEASQLQRVSTSVSVSTSSEVESVVLNSRDTLHFKCVDDFEVALTSWSFGTTRQRTTLPLSGCLVWYISIRRSNAHDRRCVDVAVLLEVKENWYINLYNINTTTNEVTSVGQMAAEDGQYGRVEVACDHRVYLAPPSGSLRLYNIQFGTHRLLSEDCYYDSLQQLHSVPGGVIFLSSDLSTLVALDGNGERLWRVPVDKGARCRVDYTGRYCVTVLGEQLRVYEIVNNDLKPLNEKKGRIRVVDGKKGEIRAVKFFPSKSSEIERVYLAVFYEKSALEVYEIKGHEVSTIRRIIVPIQRRCWDGFILPEVYTEEASIWLRSSTSNKMWVLNTHSRTFDVLEFPGTIDYGYDYGYDYDSRALAIRSESTVVVSWPSANEGV